MFIRLYKISEKNQQLRKFCIDILKMYEKHDIDKHIQWKKIGERK